MGMLQTCRNVSQRHVGECWMLTNHSINAIACYLASKLTYLKLIDWNLINDENIEALVSSCPNIQSIYLYDTDITETSIIKLCQLDKLSELAIVGNDNLTGLGLQAISSKLGNSLRYLDLSYCQKLEDNEIMHTVKNFKCLDHLELYGMNQKLKKDTISYLNSKIRVVKYDSSDEENEQASSDEESELDLDQENEQASFDEGENGSASEELIPNWFF